MMRTVPSAIGNGASDKRESRQLMSSAGNDATSTERDREWSQ